MMELGEPPQKRATENIVPMINVVFLLLVFFLLTATIAPPDPVETEPPEGQTDDQPVVDRTLYLTSDGRIVWNGAEGDAALLALAETWAADPPVQPLTLRADRSVAGVDAARLLSRLADLGIRDINLATQAAR